MLYLKQSTVWRVLVLFTMLSLEWCLLLHDVWRHLLPVHSWSDLDGSDSGETNCLRWREEWTVTVLTKTRDVKFRNKSRCNVTSSSLYLIFHHKLQSNLIQFAPQQLGTLFMSPPSIFQTLYTCSTGMLDWWLAAAEMFVELTSSAMTARPSLSA